MSRARQGFTVVESCVAAALLTAALAIAVAMLTSVARQRQAAGRHARALLAADNLLTRIAAEPYASLTGERAAEICRQSPDGQALSPSSASVEVVSSGSLTGKKITVGVDWQPGGKGPPARQRLVTWVFPAEERP